MIWFLIFCSSPTSSSGAVCNQPVQYPNERVCRVIGQDMVDMASGYGRFRCRPIRKGKN
jgi:hypothetical protein